MAAPKLTPQQQRDRRAKLMLAVLGVVLLAVLGLQLPKLMKSGGGAAAPPPPAATVPGAALSSLAAATAQPSSSQLVRFTRFAPKNPFDPRVKVPTGPAGGSTAGAGGGTSTTPAAPKAKKATTPTVTVSVTQQKQQSQAAAGPVVPQVPAALLLVNGKRRVLALDTAFPKRGPLFRIVSLSKQAVWIQLIGGTFENGSRTMKIERGRKVTLVNTTTGTRYQLRLLKPTTAPAPPVTAKAAPPAAATTTTATTQSSPTVTTALPSSSG